MLDERVEIISIVQVRCQNKKTIMTNLFLVSKNPSKYSQLFLIALLIVSWALCLKTVVPVLCLFS